jgi:membrane protease YdiL (CAAX protease family)
VKKKQRMRKSPLSEARCSAPYAAPVVGLAIATSAGLQTLYHFYQGIPFALAHAAGFLVFACFYARFRRIAPVIVVHAWWDLFAVSRLI